MRALLGEGVAAIGFEREHVDMPARSPDEWVDYMADAYGPLVRARAALRARAAWEPLRAELTQLARAHQTPGADALRAEYLIAIVCLRA
ncbi:MAG TPA: hypothetical protein VKV21_18620 [Solirubrobacteraceae bacterium]|nr:hypothetical protein [Solirubrobacteraceae bacterium]